MCPQPNAHEEAEVELERLQVIEMQKMRRREEQLEKAHIRGKQALRREHLEQVQLSKWRTSTNPSFYSLLKNHLSLLF